MREISIKGFGHLKSYRPYDKSMSRFPTMLRRPFRCTSVLLFGSAGRLWMERRAEQRSAKDSLEPITHILWRIKAFGFLLPQTSCALDLGGWQVCKPPAQTDTVPDRERLGDRRVDTDTDTDNHNHTHTHTSTHTRTHTRSCIAPWMEKLLRKLNFLSGLRSMPICSSFYCNAVQAGT